MYYKLTSVSGIGSRSAIILGSMPLRELTMAIVLSDIVSLSRALALVKLPSEWRLSLRMFSADMPQGIDFAAQDVSVSAASPVGEAILALESLGYHSMRCRQYPPHKRQARLLIRRMNSCALHFAAFRKADYGKRKTYYKQNDTRR